MKKNKLFTFTYRAEIVRLATVEAKNEDEARSKFDNGEFQDGHDVDCLDMDDFKIISED